MRDDRGNHRVSSPHRLHRHLSALEDVKFTVVEVRTQRFERFTCVDCGFVTTRSKAATEDPAMCPYVETDTRGSSKSLVRHTCKACLKLYSSCLAMKPQCGKVQEKMFLERTHLNFVTSVARCMHDHR